VEVNLHIAALDNKGLAATTVEGVIRDVAVAVFDWPVGGWRKVGVARQDA
jgi:hypothetical protein